MKAYKNRELKKRGGAATMLKIGEFSKLTQVSVRMLRHYDEIGLLKPAETEYRLKLIDIAKNKFRKAETTKYNPTIKTFPARYAATLRTIIPRYEDKGTVWALLCRETDPLNMSPADPCLCGVTFLDGEYKEKDVEVEAWKTVKGSYADTEHVRFRTLPEVTVVSYTCKGSYEQMGEVNTAILERIAATGCRPNGPMFNIYHVNPHETSNPEEFITEVCYPIEKR